MDELRPFDKVRVGELTLVRHGFFCCWYKLTDGQFMYGKITYIKRFMPVVLLEVAGKSWQVASKSIFSNTLIITLPDTGEQIAQVKPDTWARKTRLEMESGFAGTFTSKSIFSRTYTFTNESMGDIFNIEQMLWKLKTPFKVTFDQGFVKTLPDMPLLLLVGAYTMLLRQQQAAAR